MSAQHDRMILCGSLTFRNACVWYRTFVRGIQVEGFLFPEKHRCLRYLSSVDDSSAINRRDAPAAYRRYPSSADSNDSKVLRVRTERIPLHCIKSWIGTPDITIES